MVAQFANMALVAYGSSGEESDGDQPPESLQSKEKDQKSMLSAYIAPSSGLGKKGQKKVVRIGLPSLVEKVRLSRVFVMGKCHVYEYDMYMETCRQDLRVSLYCPWVIFQASRCRICITQLLIIRFR